MIQRRATTPTSAMEESGIRALQLIESVGNTAPFLIRPISLRQGTAMPAEDVMAAKVKWARRAGYRVLTRNVPADFAPYNAVIQISEKGTEDRNRDYLAVIIDELQEGNQ